MGTLKDKSGLLKQDRNQRILYGFGLFIWIVFWIPEWKQLGGNNLPGLQYIFFIIVPTLLLIGQLILNNKIIWFLLFGLVIFYSFWSIWRIVFFEILIDFHRDYAPTSYWNLEKFQNPLINFSVLILLNWTLWKIKPGKNICTTAFKNNA